MKDYGIIIAGGRIDEDFALRFLMSRMPGAGSGKPLLSGAGSGKPFLSGTGSGKQIQTAADFEKTLLIAADRGLMFLEGCGIVPDLAVGDFDSAGESYVERYLGSHPGVAVKRYSWEKDYTDTEIAVRQAAEEGCRRIDILGATGTRFDHVLGSVQILAMLLERGITGRILDPYNRITMRR